MRRWEHSVTWVPSPFDIDGVPIVPAKPDGDGWELVTVSWPTGCRDGIAYWKRLLDCEAKREAADARVVDAESRIEELETAILESSRHLFGKCDCATLAGDYAEVACAANAQKPLQPFVTTGEPPEFEFQLVSTTSTKGAR